MSYPATFKLERPASLSRGLVIAKALFGWLYVGIPHGIIIYIFGIVASLVSIIAFFAILFTGQYPRGLFNFMTGYYRWSMNVNTYLSLLQDAYPPFNLDQESDYPVELDVEYPESLSRGLVLAKAFFGWLYAGIPHGIILYFYGIAAAIVTIIAWFAILFTGEYPEGMFTFVVGYWRWTLNVSLYLSLMRDEYPPFSGAE